MNIEDLGPINRSRGELTITAEESMTGVCLDGCPILVRRSDGSLWQSPYASVSEYLRALDALELYEAGDNECAH